MEKKSPYYYFGIGDEPEVIGEDDRELSRLLDEIPHCPLRLYDHRFVYFLETFIRSIDDPELPDNYRRIVELDGLEDEYGAPRSPGIGWAKYRDAWYLLGWGQGTGCLRSTVSEPDLQAILAERPWAGDIDNPPRDAIKFGEGYIMFGSEHVPEPYNPTKGVPTDKDLDDLVTDLLSD